MTPRPTSWPPIGQRLSDDQIADKLAQYEARIAELVQELRSTYDSRRYMQAKAELRFKVLQIAAIKSARDRPVYPDEHDFALMGKAS